MANDPPARYYELKAIRRRDQPSQGLWITFPRTQPLFSIVVHGIAPRGGAAVRSSSSDNFPKCVDVAADRRRDAGHQYGAMYSPHPLANE